MPELPEVQTTVNGINKYAKNLKILDVWTDYKSSFHIGKDNIKNPEYFKKFKKIASSGKIKNASRIGKNVLIHLSNGFSIIIHMKMTGHLIYGKYRKEKNKWMAEDETIKNDLLNRFVHLVFKLSDGKCLALSDMRKFARISAEKTENLEKSEYLEKHGPEPLEKKFTFEKFKERLATKPNWPIKTTLMDYSVISGIGNIYSDEILWRAGIHPLTKIKKISDKRFKATFIAMKKVLALGINFGGDSMSDYRNILGKKGKFQEKHEAYQREGERCRKPGCGGIIKRIKIKGRSAHFCDKHQTLNS